jgi:F-type H+-transporting ATPase subunit epsilon
MATQFHCTVVTPNAISLDEKATYVSFEAWDGQFGVIPGASPFLTRLGTGMLTVTLANGSKRQLLADGGFAQMQGEHLTLLADSTQDIAGIDARQAEAGLAEANQKAIAPGTTTTAQRDAVERAQRVAQARVSAARTVAGRRA